MFRQGESEKAGNKEESNKTRKERKRINRPISG
jgi:hypothetical protein